MVSDENEQRAQRIVSEVFGRGADGPSVGAVTSALPPQDPARAHIAERARAVVDAVFDPPPPAPPPAPAPPTERQLAARRIVAEAEAAAVARREAAERARREAEEAAREAAERARREAEEAAREAAERARREAEEAREDNQRHPPAPEPPAAEADPESLFPDEHPPGSGLFTDRGSDPGPLSPVPEPPEPGPEPPEPGPEPPGPVPTVVAGDPEPPEPPDHSRQRPEVPEPLTLQASEPDDAEVAARLAAEAIEHRERQHPPPPVDRHEADETLRAEPSAVGRAARWVVVTLLAAVALAWLVPVTIAAVLELVALS